MTKKKPTGLEHIYKVELQFQDSAVPYTLGENGRSKDPTTHYRTKTITYEVGFPEPTERPWNKAIAILNKQEKPVKGSIQVNQSLKIK